MSSSWFRWDAGSWATCSPARNSKQVFGKIYELSHRVSFQIKTTEAMHYRRYLLQHNLEERQHGTRPSGRRHVPDSSSGVTSPARRPADAQTRTASWATRRVNDGKGFMFISHVGNVYPSGFSAHPRRQYQRDAARRYLPQRAHLQVACATPSKLEGKCGACEYKEICGGSRARAYAVTGDPLAQEPCCIYQPRNWDPQLENEAQAFAKS